MLATLMLAALVVQDPAPAAPVTPPPFQVVVAAPVYHPDGAVRAESATLPAGGPSVVYLYTRDAVCQIETARGTEPAAAAFGWRVASQVVAASATEVIVSIDWRRAWDRGVAVADGPGSSVQLTLHPGDRIPLDHIVNQRPTRACDAVGLGLELKLARVVSAAPAAGTMLPSGAVESGGRDFDAELWLMHTTPAGTERVQHQKVRMAAGRAAFSFAPSAIEGAKGDANVEFTGSLIRYRTPGGEDLLLVSMSRAITGGDVPAGGYTRQTSTLTPLPGPADVFAFEMPTPTSGGGAARGAVFGGGGVGGGRGGSRGAGGGPVTSARSGGGGVAGGGGGGRAMAGVATALQAVAMLEGHAFAMRVRLTPVN
jgi:hypothetical protein